MFDFGDLFLLEVSFKSFINFIIICGAVLFVLRFISKIRKFVVRLVIKNFVVSFFSTISFMSYVVSSLNQSFLKRSSVSYKVVDLG